MIKITSAAFSLVVLLALSSGFVPSAQAGSTGLRLAPTSMISESGEEWDAAPQIVPDRSHSWDVTPIGVKLFPEFGRLQPIYANVGAGDPPPENAWIPLVVRQVTSDGLVTLRSINDDDYLGGFVPLAGTTMEGNGNGGFYGLNYSCQPGETLELQVEINA
jgi:hypothetical protein